MKDKRPLYVISVAASLVNMHPQTLRLYEKKGFINPQRYRNRRLYTEKDIEKLRYIYELTHVKGVNMAGVEIILEKEREVEKLQEKIRELEEEFERKLKEIEKEAREEIERIKREFSENENLPALPGKGVLILRRY